MDDTKVYNQKLKQLQSHLPFLSKIISKIKATSQDDQNKYLSKVEKLYQLVQNTNSKEIKPELMIKAEETIIKMKEKYQLKVVDASTKKTSIQTTELTENAAIQKDDLSDEVHSVSSDSSSPSRKFDKYQNDRYGGHNKNNRFPSDSVKRYSSRYDQHEPRKTDRHRYENSYKHGYRQVKKENRSSGSSKNESTDVESENGFETEIKCERSDRHSRVGRQNSKLVINPFSDNSAFNRFGTKMAKVSSNERLTESDASELKACHSRIFGCDSDNEYGLELKNLIDKQTKLKTQIAEREKRNEHKTAASDLPTPVLSKISSTTPIPTTGLKVKLDLLKRQNASKECGSALSTESGRKHSSKFSFSETFGQTNKSTKTYSEASAKPLVFASVDDDIIAKLLTPIIYKNDVTSSTSKHFTTAQNVSVPWIMDVVEQALATPKKTEEGKSNASEIADQHKPSEAPHSNHFVRSSDPRLSIVRDVGVQPQPDSIGVFSPSPAMPPSQGRYNMNGLAEHPVQQHTFPSTSQYRIQSRPYLLIKEPQNYKNQPVNSTVISQQNRGPHSEYRPLLNIEHQRYEQSRPVNSRLNRDSENQKASMTYGEYKLNQQVAVASTSKNFNKNKPSKVSSEYKRNLQTVASSTSDKFNKNTAQMTSDEHKRSPQTVLSYTPEKFDEENVTSKSSTDISKSHLDNIYRSGNFSTKPNLFATGSMSNSCHKFKIPKKKLNGATESNDIESNAHPTFRGVKDLDNPNLSVSSSKCTTGNNIKIPNKKLNVPAKSSDIQANGHSNIRDVNNLDGPNLSVTGSKPNSGNNFKIPKKKSNYDIEASESRDPARKKSALDGNKMKESTTTELPQSMKLQNDVATNSTSFVADNQLTVTQEDIETMLQQVMNPKNLLTLMTLCAERSDDQIFSKIRDIIQGSNATIQLPSIEERTDGQSTLVEAGKKVTKTPRRKNELEKLNEDIRTMFISDGVTTATGRRICFLYNQATEEPVAALNAEERQNQSKDDGAVVYQRTVEPPSNVPSIMRRRNTMIAVHPKTTIESNGDDMNDSLRVTQSPLTKQCTVVLLRLHPGSTVKSLTSIASSKKAEERKRRIREIDETKKRLSSQTAVVKNNNPEWHCLKKGMECQLCEKSIGISLVSHYVNSHPNNEVFPCRVTPDVADFLRNSKEEHKVECIVSKRSIQHRFKQRCYFCNETKSLLKTYWMMHTAVHTGYYQYKCTDCNRRFSSGSNHHSCKGTTKNKLIKEALPQLNRKEIFGYLCDLCNFVRFDKNEMAKHLRNEHESNGTTKYKKVLFLRFPRRKMNRKIESNTVEQINTADLDIKPHIDSLVESNSRKRSKEASNMSVDDAELEDNLPEKVRKKNEGTERVKTESLDPLMCDDGIPIIIKTQMDEDSLMGLMEQNYAKETPKEKTSSWTTASVRESDGTAHVTPQPLDYLIVKEEENPMEPTKSEITSSAFPEKEDWETVNTDSTNNSNGPTNVLTRVYNMGYTKSFDIMGNCIKFSCLLDLCGFETMSLDSLLSHIEDHTVKWTGFCSTCNAQIINNQVPLMIEFKHMTEEHLNKIDDSDCGEKSGERTPFIKCIELSKLQKAEYAARVKQDTTSSVFENDIITNVTSLPVTNVDVSSFVISNVVSLEANKPDHCHAEINTLKRWTRNHTSKLQSHCKMMMREISMFALFKCMDVVCSFTTNNDEIMLNHLQNHEIRDSQISSFDANTYSWLECAYCDEIGDSPQLLVKHIQDEHQSSIFQCSYCFYRSIAAYNVIVHLSQFHQSKEKLVLICNGETKGYATEKSFFERSRKEFVRPLRCSEDNKSTFVMDYFIQHMNSSPYHSNTFKCQFCGFDILITEAVKHLLCHRIGIFECVYCQFGANDIGTIQKHMCNSHPSKLLYICVRLTRKSRILTDEQLSSVESTMIVGIGQPVNSKFFQRCPYSEEQLNFLSPSLDMNSNKSAAITAPIAYNQCLPTAIEINAATSMLNQTFFNAETLGSSSERCTEVLSYEDFEKEYISDDYDKYFQNKYQKYFGSLPLPEQPSTSNSKRKSSDASLPLPKNMTELSTSSISLTDSSQNVIDTDDDDLDFHNFKGFNSLEDS